MSIKKVCLYLLVSSLVLFLFVDTFVIATDGFVAYRSNSGTDGVNSPKIRYWNNTFGSGNGTYNSEVELTTTGSPIRNVILLQSPINSKIVLVAQTDNGFLHGYVCMKNCNVAGNWTSTLNITPVWASAPATHSRRFNMNFESNSGDLILYFGTNISSTSQDIGYIELYNQNTSFSGLPIMYFDDAGHGTELQYTWLVGDSNPLNTSNEIVIAGFDSTNSDMNAWVWNGTNFTNENEISAAAASTSGFEALGVQYASDGSKCMVASGDGNAGNINSEYWSSGSWTALTAVDVTAGGNDVSWINIKSDPTTDDLQLVSIDTGQDLATMYWNGSVWSTFVAVDTAVDTAASRVADFDWLPSGNTGILVWDTDTTGTTLSTRICNPQCTSTNATISTYGGATSGAWIRLFTNPLVSSVAKIIGIRLQDDAVDDLGSFRYNGTGANYTNYGDTVLSASTVITFESFFFDFRRDKRLPPITLLNPNTSILVRSSDNMFFNFTTDEYLEFAYVEFNNTNYSMNGTDTYWYYNLTNIQEGFYYYLVYAIDYANNTNFTQRFNVTINYPPNITLEFPLNNTLNLTSRNITFYYNVSDVSDNVSSCSLIIDGNFVMNQTGPINETITNNFTYLFPIIGQHNWSVYCNDTFNLNRTSGFRNITILITPQLSNFLIDEGISPSDSIILSAGRNRTINCSITATDPEGINNILNASARFYYYSSNPLDPDNNNTHYTNTNCTLDATGLNSKNFSCLFDVEHYANNGTWNCNVTVFNSYNIFNQSTIQTNISALYAINITDGISFGNVESNIASDNISVNMTNFGNMPINVTIQGYARILGDGVGMNCSDNTNITISNIKFSTNSSYAFVDKTSLTGLVQSLSITIPKRTGADESINYTYWQISPDAGSKDRFCNGFVIFSAEAP